MAGSSKSPDANEPLDLRCLKCPMPALIAKRYMAAVAPGTVVVVLTDDPMAAVDVPHMCKAEGYEVLDLVRDGDATEFKLRRP